MLMKSSRYSYFGLLLVIFWTCPVIAAPGVVTPTELSGGRIVSVEEARKLIGEGVLIFDVRSGINYGRGHIPGAVFAPYKGSSVKHVDFDPSQDRFSLSSLPKKKGVPVLIYSHGDTGWKSYKAAVTAIRTGYTQVNWFRDGFSAWVEAGLPVEH
ncbi:MAG: rhodanese-like domain-containing protein, partial [Gammaproteobacteria bacterium]|nr:rhodanese-like domain-containing protein [Gammaproteobacteria bacterium]